MAKDAFYFSHDYNARNDEKILELRSNYGAEGYGIFWMVVEAMAEGSDGGLKAGLIGGLALGFGLPKHKLLEILNYCIDIKLFFEKDGNYYSRRLLTHKEFRNSLSNWGKKGAEKKKAGLSPPDTKEMKGNERKIESNTSASNVLKNSNLFRQPNIPKFEEVYRVFVQNGGSEEMAKTFFNSNEGTGWFKNGSPITNFQNLIPSYVESWKRNDKKSKNGIHELSEFEKSVLEKREKAKKGNYE